MAIKLANGVSLPDIPEGAFDVAPYGLIVHQVESGFYEAYVIYVFDTPAVFVPQSISGQSNSIILTHAPANTTMYLLTVGTDTEWTPQLIEEEDTVTLPVIDGAFEVVWSNHDVYTATAFDNTTQEATVGTEIYFANSEAEEVIEYIATGTEFKTVADAIRSKGGTTASMEWPDGFTAAIEAIQAGSGEVQRSEGIFTPDSSG